MLHQLNLALVKREQTHTERTSIIHSNYGVLTVMVCIAYTTQVSS